MNASTTPFPSDNDSRTSFSSPSAAFKHGFDAELEIACGEFDRLNDAFDKKNDTIDNDCGYRYEYGYDSEVEPEPQNDTFDDDCGYEYEYAYESEIELDPPP